jgi:hypothetical protein
MRAINYHKLYKRMNTVKSLGTWTKDEYIALVRASELYRMLGAIL